MSSPGGGVREVVVHPQPRIRGFMPGDVVAGKYRVQRIVGAGGMGVVVVATDVQLKRQVAIKAMSPMLAADERAVQRFLREARAAVRLSGEHTVRVFEVGELPSGVPFMAMEFLVGRDLESVAADRGRLPFREAVDLILQATEGLAEAHAAHIVHRDLKPANLFLTKRTDGSPLVKVVDFGLAKAPVATDDTKLTSPSAVFGTHHYMSPEQLRGSSDVDHRTDIWALGVCLYQLITGRMPFQPPSSRDRRRTRVALDDLSRMIVFGDPKAPHDLVADIPFGLSAVVMRCLEKKRQDRFESVAELAAALEPFASVTGVGVGARLERVLEEQTLVTGDVKVGTAREKPDSTTERIERPQPARELPRDLRQPLRAAVGAAKAWALMLVGLVRRGADLLRERTASECRTEPEEPLFGRAARVAAHAYSLAIARVGRVPRGWSMVAATALLVGFTCFFVAFMSAVMTRPPAFPSEPRVARVPASLAVRAADRSPRPREVDRSRARRTHDEIEVDERESEGAPRATIRPAPAPPTPRAAPSSAAEHRPPPAPSSGTGPSAKDSCAQPRFMDGPIRRVKPWCIDRLR